MSRSLGLRHVELDAIFHQPGWTELTDEDFRQRVDRLTVDGGWIVDGNYTDTLQDIVWNRADTIVWLDLPRPLVMRRIVIRTLGRVVLRRELWNGNRERWQNLYSRDPLKSMIAWAWTQHGKYTQRYERALADPRWNGVRFIRLRSPRHINAFLNEL